MKVMRVVLAAQALMWMQGPALARDADDDDANEKDRIWLSNIINKES